MNKLSKKQKTILKQWVKQNSESIGYFFDAEDLPNDVYSKVINLGDHETIHQNMTRYINDIAVCDET